MDKSNKTGRKPSKNADLPRTGKMVKTTFRPFCCGKKLPRWAREFLAEFIGTFILIFMGQAAIAGYDLQGVSALFAVAFAFGIAAMIGVAMSQSISGAHLNPAVTLARATIGKVEYWRIPHYMAAQYLGAFVASAVCFIMYYPTIDHFDGGTRVAWSGVGKNSTGGIFSTYPREWLPIWTPLYDQIVATAIMCIALEALFHPRSELPSYLHPFIAGMMIAGLVVSFGYQCGATLNPARDLGPRLFQLCAGYGIESFKPLSSTYWFTAGLIGPHIGALLGTWGFYVFIHYDDVDDIKEKELEKAARPTR